MFRRRQYFLQYNDSYSNRCKCDHLSLSYPCLEFLWKPAVFGQPAQSSKCVVSMLGSCCQCNTRCPTDTYCKPGKQVYFPQFVSSESHSLCPVKHHCLVMFGAGLIHGSPSQREIKVAVYTAYMLFQQIQSSTRSTPHMTQVCRSYVYIHPS